MQRLRTTWGCRLVVLSLGLSLLPGLLAPAMQAAAPVTMPFADWLRSQVRTTPDDAFEKALAEAEAQAPRSLHAFLSAFVQAYEAAGGTSLAGVFTSEALGGEALVQYLQRRYLRLVGEAVLPRAVPSAAAAPVAKTPDRMAEGHGWVRADDAAGAPLHLIGFVHEGAVRTSLVRLRTSEQPRGP
ncbi:MAG: hypothetical protein KatS3mg042_1340 [Rhodothermaceae bacterium]|nr:MAG: hypothetical protein KatS3mg042_1340 [Rhodothermaceae bacterium]